MPRRLPAAAYGVALFLLAVGYAAAVIAGTLTDPVITPQLRAGLQPLTVVQGYLSDTEARDCALLMEWPNPELT